MYRLFYSYIIRPNLVCQTRFVKPSEFSPRNDRVVTYRAQLKNDLDTRYIYIIYVYKPQMY